jgi:hypothetical protein
VAISIVSNTTPVLKKSPIRRHKTSTSSLQQSLEKNNLTTPQNISSPTVLQEISLTLEFE